MTYYFSEPTNPRYIQVNPQNNNVSLLVTVSEGVKYGTDGTCQSTAALKEFFAFNANSTERKKHALASLLAYQESLKFDLKLLEKLEINEELKEIAHNKQERLFQVNTYIHNLNEMLSNPIILGLERYFASYPDFIARLLNKSNLYSILLSPESPDHFILLQNRVFSVDRSSQNSFIATLYSGFSNLTIHRNHYSPKKLLHLKVMKELAEKPAFSSLENILEVVQASLQKHLFDCYKISNDFSKTAKAEVINLELLKKWGIDGVEQDDYEQIVQYVLNSVFTDNNDIHQDSPFCLVSEEESSQQKVRKISILLQLFLGNLNVYCVANDFSKENFARVFEQSLSLSQDLLQEVRRCFSQGDNVETGIIQFIEKNRAYFGLPPETTLDLEKIKERFSEHYYQIQNSPHFDEFSFLEPFNPKNNAIKVSSHQGGICLHFNDLVKSILEVNANCNFQFSNLEASLNDYQKQEELNHDNVHVKTALPFQDNKALKGFIAKIKDDIPFLLRFLLLQNEEGDFIGTQFSWLDLALQKQFPSEVELHYQLLNACPSSQVTHLRKKLFKNSGPVLLTESVLRALYIEYIKIADTAVITDYQSFAGIKTILKKLLIVQNDTDAENQLTGSIAEGYTFKEGAGAARIASLVETNKNAFYLSAEMAMNLYQQVADSYGSESEEYRAMNRLSNKENEPNKLRRALQLLHINTTKISFPKCQGYIIEASTFDLQLIDNIQQAHTFAYINIELCYSLYRDSTNLSPQQARDYLRQHPSTNRIREWFRAKDIEFGQIYPNSPAGFWVQLSPIHLEKFKKELDLTRNKHYFLHTQTNCHYQKNTAHNTFSAPRGADSKAIKERTVTEHLADTTNAPAHPEAQLIIQQVQAFKKIPLDATRAASVQMHCPANILQAFKTLLKDWPLLGKTYFNSYTKETSSLPSDNEQLSARYLPLLARNDAFNSSSWFDQNACFGLNLYEIAQLRCLATRVVTCSLVEMTNDVTIRYSKTDQKYNNNIQIILIEQPRLQWQMHLNNGGLFFYPDTSASFRVTQGYLNWQKSTFKILFGRERPAQCSANNIFVYWMEMKGFLDLDLLSEAIALEFTQALNALVTQIDCLTRKGQSLQKINFKYLKAGMGMYYNQLFSEDEIGNNIILNARFERKATAEKIEDTIARAIPRKKIRTALEHARLKGILLALQQIRGLSLEERNKRLRGIARLELPFSGKLGNNQPLPMEMLNTIAQIRKLCFELNLEWGGAMPTDAMEICPGYTNAVNTSSTVNTMFGNLRPRSRYTTGNLEEHIYNNLANPDLLNCAYNDKMQIIVEALDYSKPGTQTEELLPLNESELTAEILKPEPTEKKIDPAKASTPTTVKEDQPASTESAAVMVSPALSPITDSSLPNTMPPLSSLSPEAEANTSSISPARSPSVNNEIQNNETTTIIVTQAQVRNEEMLGIAPVQHENIIQTEPTRAFAAANEEGLNTPERIPPLPDPVSSQSPSPISDEENETNELPTSSHLSSSTPEILKIETTISTLPQNHLPEIVKPYALTTPSNEDVPVTACSTINTPIIPCSLDSFLENYSQDTETMMSNNAEFLLFSSVVNGLFLTGLTISLCIGGPATLTVALICCLVIGVFIEVVGLNHLEKQEEEIKPMNQNLLVFRQTTVKTLFPKDNQTKASDENNSTLDPNLT